MRWLLMFAAPLLAAAAQHPDSLLTPEELAGDWKISAEFTLEVARSMPAADYAFKPTPGQMSFGQQIVHIAVANVYRFAQLTGDKPPFPLAKLPADPDKEAAVRYLTQSFDYVLAVLPKLTPEQLNKMVKVDWKGRPEVNGRQMMMNMFVHVAHHRAQCEVYLRLKNIRPPDYRF